MENISIFAALGGGIASFLCPCHLSLIPVYLASLAGPELSDAELSNGRLPIFLHSFFFVLGLGLFLAIIGVLVALASQFIDTHALLLTLISAGLLILLGIYSILSIKFPRINFECHLPTQNGINTGYLRSFVIGATYSFVHAPCATPILLSIFTLALGTGNPLSSGVLLFVYFLGYGLPFLIAGAAIGLLMPLFKKANTYHDEIYIASGLILIVAGAAILVRLIA
jgi:cytochrome c-type biogenesis protein